MARRTTVNITGITSLKDVEANAAWAFYVCVNCKKTNLVKIGTVLPTAQDAFENFGWECEHCGYNHSKDSDLPSDWDNWPDDFLENDSEHAQRFWQVFFQIATDSKENYWKQCKTCGRILPSEYFARHAGKTWLPLERQRECKCCKGAINAKLNALRTKEQLHEGNIRRRVADMFVSTIKRDFSDSDLFNKFEGKCFKCNKSLILKNRSDWAIDHIMPSKYLWPLTSNNSALLCKECNSNKRDKWPRDFYTNSELHKLSEITGGNLELWSQPTPIINENVDVNQAVINYLNTREYSKLHKRIMELKKIIEDYDLINKLSDDNKKKLGYIS